MLPERAKQTIAVIVALVVTAGAMYWYMADLRGRMGDEKLIRRTLGVEPAPEFPDGLEWLNTDRPLRLAELKGKFVLLNFWAGSKINCTSTAPDLAKLQLAYPDELVVVGVHSAKFPAEGDIEHVRQAVVRQGIAHPVVNDPDRAVWQSYDVKTWPTVVLVAPNGNVLVAHHGRGVFEPIDEAITGAIDHYRSEGTLDLAPLDAVGRGESVDDSLLLFPGKVLAVAGESDRPDQLFVADSGRNRIVVVSLADGAVVDVIGSGEAGLDDGAFETATFNNPQGMVLDGQVLYVADAGNHVLRAVDFEARRVMTVAGTGERADPGAVGGKGRRTSLNSPWDLALVERHLYVAMAGAHQVWRMDIDSGVIEPVAGSGREAKTDGAATDAAFAQPSGLAFGGGTIYVADSQASSVRAVDTVDDGEVRTIVGGDLFDFGDRDGAGLAVRLQYPLDVAWTGDVLYVADTFNHKIKIIDPASCEAATFVGSGSRGLTDGDDPSAVQFNAPAGLCALGQTLYVADTNNHAIRIVDLIIGSVSTLQLEAP